MFSGREARLVRVERGIRAMLRRLDDLQQRQVRGEQEDRESWSLMQPAAAACTTSLTVHVTAAGFPAPAGLTVTANGNSATTDATGTAVFNPINGNATYTVSCTSSCCSGSTSATLVCSPVTVTLALSSCPTHTINVQGCASKNVQGATVTWNGMTGTTDASGNVAFPIVAPSTLTIAVSKSPRFNNLTSGATTVTCVNKTTNLTLSANTASYRCAGCADPLPLTLNGSDTNGSFTLTYDVASGKWWGCYLLGSTPVSYSYDSLNGIVMNFCGSSCTPGSSAGANGTCASGQIGTCFGLTCTVTGSAQTPSCGPFQHTATFNHATSAALFTTTVTLTE